MHCPPASPDNVCFNHSSENGVLTVSKVVRINDTSVLHFQETNIKIGFNLRKNSILIAFCCSLVFLSEAHVLRTEKESIIHTVKKTSR